MTVNGARTAQRQLELARGTEVAARAFERLDPAQRNEAEKAYRIETLARLAFNNSQMRYTRNGKNIECAIRDSDVIGQMNYTVVAAEVGGPAWPSENFVAMVTLGVMALQGDNTIVTDVSSLSAQERRDRKAYMRAFRMSWCYEEWLK